MRTVMALLLMCGTAYGAEGHISANVEEPVTIRQTDTGNLTITGSVSPIYCVASPTETICYY